MADTKKAKAPAKKAPEPRVKIDAGFVADRDFAAFRRRPGSVRATFVPGGRFDIETATGIVSLDAPFWLAFDDKGFLYPISPETFQATYEYP